MINIEQIGCTEFDLLITEFDKKTDYLKTQFNIELRSYGNIIRIALNTIQTEVFEDLIERLEINRELENELSKNGYSLSYISQNNPKNKLLQILCYLKENPLKRAKLVSFFHNSKNRGRLIADINDIDFLKQNIRNNQIDIIPLNNLKKRVSRHDNLIFYSFNGQKDFDFIYNLHNSISLILYEQEVMLYHKQLQGRKQSLEQEINSEIRFSISGIKYEPIPDLPINISNTIELIVNRIDNFNTSDYKAYKEEADILLDHIEGKTNYKINFIDGSINYLESNETVFTNKGDLLKASKIKTNDIIRIYPQNQFAEKLYSVATETERDIFGKIESDSRLWISLLKELKIEYSNILYDELKKTGLKVLPITVDGYLNGQRKFPMYNNDLKAIFKLKFAEKSDFEIDDMLISIRKSKATYNSTMIALGRGLKQEIKLFLKEKRVGEILSKLKFDTNTLQVFVNEYMPLQTIKEKVTILYDSEEIQRLNLIQYTEL
jgi:hypothetical protein